MGYHRAGFDVTGVDVKAQPRYPFRFWRLDVLELEPWALAGFDAIHASPPCQAYSVSTRDRQSHPQMIAPVRALLKASGRPYVIENVPGAPLLSPTVLCGSALGLRVRRHRHFETSFGLLAPGCQHALQGRPVGVYGHSGGNGGSHHLAGTVGEWREAMGMPWATGGEIAQAVPPAYAELIGWQLRAVLS